MILKHKDPIQPAVDCLEALASRSDLDAKTVAALRRELAAMRRGEKGERECAFHLDGVVKDHPRRVLIHDLRIEHEGEAAQFDHVLINCKMEVWILESKTYLNGFRISDQGEFEYWYDNRYHAMPSPIEQAKRQARILEKAFAAHSLAPKRLGFTLAPAIKTAILVDPKTRVIRPAAKVFNTDMVIKADAFFTRYEQMMDEAGTMEVLGSLAKLVKKETIIEIGQRLVALHRPHLVDYRAKFGIAETSATTPVHPQPTIPKTTLPEPSPPAVTDTAAAEPSCPKCGAGMVLRCAKRGANAGASFWGCSSYPACRGMVAREAQVSTPAIATPPPIAIANPQVTASNPDAPAATATVLAPAPACPRCGTTMVRRIAKQGGKPFWGCPTFPKCRGMISIDPA